MKIRRPIFDFTEVDPVWTTNRWVAHRYSASSTCLPYLEPYLNRVMMRAKEVIHNVELKQDIDLFVGQEGNHYRVHRAYNQILYGKYPGLRDIELKLEDDYKRFLNEKSLSYNVGYCEGFESIGIIQTEFFFQHGDAFMPNADPAVVGMWKWHLAEEFEHRSVCFDVQRAVGSGYIGRLGGLLAAIRHLAAYNASVMQYILSVDFSTLSDAEIAEVEGKAREYRSAYSAFARPRMLAILSPFYNPNRKKAPASVDSFLGSLAD